MAKQVRHEDLFEPKITKEIIKDFDALIKKTDQTTEAFNDLKKSLQDIKKIDNAKDLEDLAKILDAVNKNEETLLKTKEEQAKLAKKAAEQVKKTQKAQKEGSKIAQDRIKLEKKLKEARSDEIQDNVQIQIQLQEQKKANVELEKEKLGLINAYDKEAKRLNKLRKEYKGLVIEGRSATKEAEELRDEIVKLDKALKDADAEVGQFQRNVGNYTDGMEDAAEATKDFAEEAQDAGNEALDFAKKVGAAALIAKVLDVVKDAFGDTREGALQLQLFFANFTESAKVFINSVISSFTGIRALFSAIGDSFALIEKRATLAFLKIDKAASILPDTIERLDAEIAALNSEIEELEQSSVSDAIDQITGAFKGNVEATKNSIAAQKEFLELQLATRISIEQQEKALAGLAEQRQILQDISDDDTLGFITRTKAVKEAQEAAIEFAKAEERLAITREKLAFAAARQDLIRAKISVASVDAQETQAEKSRELIRLLQDENIARKVSDENDEAFTAAFVERRNKEVEAEAFRRDQEEKNRKTRRDAFEQELDILEEFTEKRVASNAQIIASDSASLQERQRALQENQRLEKELFDESVRLILEQGKASIDLRKDLTEQEKEQQKALLTTQAIEEIINEQDQQEIFNLIRKLDLGEIEEKRLKETLKIKQDIAQTNKDSLTVEEQAARKTIQLEEEVALQRRALAGEAIDLEDARLEAQKKNLQETIDLAKEGSIERLQAEKELNDLLLGEQKKAADERAEARQQIINDTLNEFQAELDKRNEMVNASLDAEIASRQRAIELQSERARNGLTNNLAFEEAELEKANLRRKRELERQQKEQESLALFTAYLNQFAALSVSDPKSAAFEAATNTFLARGLARQIAGTAYDGTEDTGDGGGLDSKNGQLWMIHPHERIMTADQNKIVGNLSNDELAKLAQDYHNGNTWSFMPQVSAIKDEGATAKAVIESNEKVIKAIKSMPVPQWDAAGFMKIIESRVSEGKKELITYINKKNKY